MKFIVLQCFTIFQDLKSKLSEFCSYGSLACSEYGWWSHFGDGIPWECRRLCGLCEWPGFRICKWSQIFILFPLVIGDHSWYVSVEGKICVLFLMLLLASDASKHQHDYVPDQRRLFERLGPRKDWVPTLSPHFTSGRWQVLGRTGETSRGSSCFQPSHYRYGWRTDAPWQRGFGERIRNGDGVWTKSHKDAMGISLMSKTRFILKSYKKSYKPAEISRIWTT